jgi:hypothetical protein
MTLEHLCQLIPAGISVASVLANDTLDGVQANVYTVILTQISSTSPSNITQITVGCGIWSCGW